MRWYGPTMRLRSICWFVFTARNEVGARLYFHRRLWFCSGRGVLSQHALQVVSQHTLQQVSGGGGGIQVCLAGFQAHGQGGSWGGSGPGPQPRGKLRGIWSRPTPKGELRGIWPGGSALLGVCSGRGVETPHDRHCCGRYALYWNAFLFLGTFLMTIF